MNFFTGTHAHINYYNYCVISTKLGKKITLRNMVKIILV